MEDWEAISGLAERMTVIMGLLLLLIMVVSDKFIWTKARGLEWKERAQEAEKRAQLAEAELRENTSAIRHLAEKAEEGNKTQAEILRTLLSEKQR